MASRKSRTILIILIISIIVIVLGSLIAVNVYESRI